MLQFPLKNLFLSSLLLVFFASCSPTLNYKLSGEEVVLEKDVHSLINRDTSLLFKANINFYNKYYSGLIILKQTAAETSHLVFVTELGMKMFDYEIKNNAFNLISIFEPLNKPQLLEVLQRDFKLILLHDLINHKAEVYSEKYNKTDLYKVHDKKERTYYFVDKKSSSIQQSIVKGRLFKKKKVSYAYDDQASLKQIKLKHKGLLFLKIELHKIEK